MAPGSSRLEVCRTTLQGGAGLVPQAHRRPRIRLGPREGESFSTFVCWRKLTHQGEARGLREADSPPPPRPTVHADGILIAGSSPSDMTWTGSLLVPRAARTYPTMVACPLSCDCLRCSWRVLSLFIEATTLLLWSPRRRLTGRRTRS